MQQTMRLITALVVVTLGISLAFDGAPAAEPDLIRQGEAQLAARDFDGAIETLTRAVAAQPGSSLAHTRLGGAYLLSQQYPSAITQFQQAIAADGDNADAFVGMAVAYLHSGRLPLAKAALIEARRLDPDKSARIDDVVAWIDRRDAHAAGGH
jgi:tetratricopeptide (TPR) repeat protein